jgi:hypothetical protein
MTPQATNLMCSCDWFHYYNMSILYIVKALADASSNAAQPPAGTYIELLTRLDIKNEYMVYTGICYMIVI